MNTPKHQTFKGIKFTRDERTGYYLSTTKVKNGKRQRMHVYVWEYFFGSVPAGCHVHHLDGNRANNIIENLAVLPGIEHVTYHAKKHAQEDPEQIKSSLEAAKEQAKKWHKSEAGKLWHKAQYEKTKEKLHAKKQYVCQWCGASFESSKSGAKFCCNNCRSAFRRASGVDNEKRMCVKCGNIFSVNKYIKQDKCPECRGRCKCVQTK